jgi:SAM-dependent methyltransferase
MSSSASSAAAPPVPERAWPALVDGAAAPYRGAGRFAWHFARGKLGRDPVFRGMLERGDLSGRSRIVDIGCGQGLLVGLLGACAAAHAADRWPRAWPAPPVVSAYQGIELMPRDVERAQRAWAASAPWARFTCADMRRAAIEPCDLIVILDVLHYVPHADQADLLHRVQQALLPAGRLLLRVGDAAEPAGFRASQWVDRVVTWARGHRAPPTWGRTLAQWRTLLESLGFRVRAVPQSQGTPFANVLLIADLAAEAPNR